MNCIWCNKNTTTDSSRKGLADEPVYANKEHIFPESVGGIKTLELGKVCQECNERLGDSVDKFLKTENFMMLKQYQDSSEILGKPIGKIRGKTDRERKVNEITNITGYGGGFTITRDQGNSNIITLTDLPDGTGGDYTYNDKFSKALYKCAINVLLDKYDNEFVRYNFLELIDFIKNNDNTDYLDWSYGVCYSNINIFPLVHFEPFVLQIIAIGDMPQAVVLMFPCAIFIVGTQPRLVNTELLNVVGSKPPKLENWEKNGFYYLKYFTGFFDGFRKAFGENLKFTLVKKEITGVKNPDDSFYLLTKCKTCGQTNPTGILRAKELILGQVNGLESGNNNGWNFHSRNDLQILTPGVDYPESFMEDFEAHYRINYPKDNDAKKMNVLNCKVLCINCNELIECGAQDCFI